MVDDSISRRAVLALPRNRIRNIRGKIVEETINVAYIEQLPSAQPDNQVHLCDSCKHTYPDCPSTKTDVIFGNWKGNDNICACNKYEPSAQPDLCDGCDRYGASCVGEGCGKLEMPEVAKDTNVPNNDCISRRAAIRILDAAWVDGTEYQGHLHERFEKLPPAQPDNSCDGCRYENADDGVLVPCGFCKRSYPDNYERRTDERQT